jgi:hypothetical protein
MAGFITVTVRDMTGKAGHIKVETTEPTLANALLLANFIEEHSDAAVVNYAAGVEFVGGATDSGSYDRVLQNLKVTCKDALGNTRVFSLLAPCDEDVGARQTAKQDYVTDLFAQMVTIKAGTAFTYLKSGLKSRLPPSAEPPEA